MDIVDYKKSEQLVHSLLSNVASLKQQLRDAFSDSVVDKEFYVHLASCIQTLDLSIRGFQRSQEWTYRLSGGAFYQRPRTDTGMLRNKP